MEEEGKRENKVIPDSVIESVHRTLANTKQLKTHLTDFISQLTKENLADLPPLERAQTLLLIAKATTILFALRLRCTGVNPDDHRVKSELERLSLYEAKLERFEDWSKAPLRPSTKINQQAATRFIEHSLPDLTSEQRKSMRAISKKGERSTIKYTDRNAQKKRKCDSSQKSVQAAAKEFLEKASREILGNEGGFKGPLKADASDDDNMINID